VRATVVEETEPAAPGGSGPTAPAGPARIVGEAMAAYERGDLEALSRFVHSDAEIEMLALQGDVARGPDGLRETLESMREGLHRPTMTRIETIGDDAALMIGRIQYADPDRGVTDRSAVWLTVLRDGMLWRTRVFGNAAEARAAYAELREVGWDASHPTSRVTE
jgi:hypothetical protein